MNTPSLQSNWVDLAILMTLVYFVFGIFRAHFWFVLSDFLGFLFSLAGALRFYPTVAKLLKSNFSLSNSFANALGFLATAVFIEFIFALTVSILVKKIPKRYWKIPGSKLLSVVPALGEGIIFSAFILTLTLALPVSPRVKTDISNSKIGGFFVQKTSGFETRLSDIFGGVVEDTLTYLTVSPGSEETIPLNVEERGLTIDEKSEVGMFNLVNEERRQRNIGELTWDENLVPVSRAHARDMWERRYFSHFSPEGEDVAARLEDANVNYRLAGENLALAPTLLIAHNGLMNSEGHRENILEPKFRRVGIGVIDNGIYGKMFVQVFTD